MPGKAGTEGELSPLSTGISPHPKPSAEEASVGNPKADGVKYPKLLSPAGRATGGLGVFGGFPLGRASAEGSGARCSWGHRATLTRLDGRQEAFPPFNQALH